MKRVVYDTAVLIAADRGDRKTWIEHKARLASGVVPMVPATVVAQASRSPKQASLRRLLQGCDVHTIDEAGAHAAGALLGRSATTDVVDASVVVLAARHHAVVATGDAYDLRRLVAATGKKLDIIEV
ncbi:MAG TPA: hypothetical protein VGQ57_11880 [Polyangiaceae bacterium]|jgi:hypothetical protein|nr:hypothetical protein [Polyangiaceae bacterium]